ncbi:MAG TPA: hypothetical protein VN207_09225 [Ktedonobacteraceae bacterium]|nr:hypothetical protein [Ktedonobacteraceae bacterium]
MIKYSQGTLWATELDIVQTPKTYKLAPFLKWAGGKEQELRYSFEQTLNGNSTKVHSKLCACW